MKALSYTNEAINELKLGQIENALKELETCFKVLNDEESFDYPHSLHDELIHYSSRYYQIKREKDLDITFQPSVSINKICLSLIELTKKTENFIRGNNNLNTINENNSTKELKYNKEESNLVDIEITINKDFEKFNSRDQKVLLNTIAKLLDMDVDGIIIKKKSRGSVKLTLSIPLEKAKILKTLINQGQLKNQNIVSGEILSDDYLKDDIPEIKQINAPFAYLTKSADKEKEEFDLYILIPFKDSVVKFDETPKFIEETTLINIHITETNENHEGLAKFHYKLSPKDYLSKRLNNNELMIKINVYVSGENDSKEAIYSLTIFYEDSDNYDSSDQDLSKEIAFNCPYIYLEPVDENKVDEDSDNSFGKTYIPHILTYKPNMLIVTDNYEVNNELFLIDFDNYFESTIELKERTSSGIKINQVEFPITDKDNFTANVSITDPENKDESKRSSKISRIKSK